jgi:hypothetical protein
MIKKTVTLLSTSAIRFSFHGMSSVLLMALFLVQPVFTQTTLKKYIATSKSAASVRIKTMRVGKGVKIASTPSTTAYSFAASKGAFTSIVGAGGTASLGMSGVDDGTVTGIPLGFTFNYGGGSYSTVSACSNGWLSFSLGDNSYTYNNNDYNGEVFDIGAALMPLFDDLRVNGNVYYSTSGTAPNRTFTIEWNSIGWDWLSSDDVVSFQVILSESGTIQFVYKPGTSTGTPSSSYGASVGLVFSDGTFLAVNDLSATATASSTDMSYYITTLPDSGLTYTFTPPALASEPTIQASSLNATHGTHDVTLNWTNGNGEGRIVLATKGSACADTLADAITYTADSLYGYGAAVGSSLVVYNGTDASTTIRGLNANTTYTFAVFEYNGAGYATNYLNTSPATITVTTSALPVEQAVKGTALRFDGSDDYVQLPSAVWFNGDFTVESWVYVRSYNQSNRLFDFGNGEGYSNVLLALSQYYNGKVCLTIYDSVGNQNSIISPTAIPLNQWVHIAVTVSGTTATIYKDGVVWVSGACGYVPENITRKYNYIGKSDWSSDSYSSMSVDEFRIWNVARTDAQIAADKDTIFSSIPSGLIGYWRFNEGSEQFAYNAASGYAGVLRNFDYSTTSGWVTSRIPPYTSATIIPTVQVSGLAIQSVSGREIALHYTAGNGAGRFIVATSGSALDSLPVQSAVYNASSIYGNGEALGNGFVVYNGSDTVVTVTGLTPLTSYTFTAFEYNGGDDTIKYLITSPATLTAAATDIPAKKGTALRFDGNDDYVEIPSGVWFNGDFTVEAWVYVRSYNRWSRLFDFGNGTGSDNVLLAISDGTSGIVNFAVYNSNYYGTNGSLNSPDTIPMNQWVHLAVTMNGTTATLYKNGSVWATGDMGMTALGMTRSYNYIGRSNWGADAYADMSVDEFRIWNSARDSVQIAADRDTIYSYSTLPSGLIGYWQFNEGSGSTTTDVVGSSTGLLNNFSFDATDGWETSTIPTTIGAATSVKSGDTKTVPAVFALNQNYPNPFNPTTTITFTLAKSGYTTLKVYDILGREVAALVNGEMKAGIVNTVTFNASKVASGVYFYRLQSGSFAETKRLVFMK